MPTLRQKVEMYEKLLHDIQMHAEVTMDGAKVARLIGNICSWSYAHRSGNGELTDKQQQARIDAAFNQLRNADVAPDANCITLPDGDCVGGLMAGKQRCMHD
jgi:hypothetical protein